MDEVAAAPRDFVLEGIGVDGGFVQLFEGDEIDGVGGAGELDLGGEREEERRRKEREGEGKRRERMRWWMDRREKEEM